ncbi:PKD domain-containing protein [Thiocapsa bogorovii]|uniref:PKD domain-containing protein n=1 Tax=Thiocapsa bogorovii TaxID=521689 RepID=UPI001E3C9849|nr:PKD domain-containing protein [Thiocapsa bogorovii]UHD17107.1 PKD domain-containing protein [Thiocapsa bogorovii]
MHKKAKPTHLKIPMALLLLFVLALLFAGSISAQTSPTPVAYWFLDETEGVTAADQFGGNDLALAGPTQWQPDSGYVDGALALSGSGAYGTRADAQLGAGIPGKLGTQTRDFTLSAWIHPTSLADRNPILVKQGAPERGLMWSAGTSDGAGRLYVEVYKSNNTTTGKTELTSSIPLTVGVWQHVAATYRFLADGSSVLTLYIDGNQVGQTTTAIGPVRANDRPLDLGRYTWNTYQRFFNGRLDEVQIFDAALTPTQIQAIIDEAELQATNAPPLAAIAATPQGGLAPLTVNFDASASSDPDGVISSYDWDFGDGATSSAIAPSHQYLAPGAYLATLTVTDNLGKTGSAEQTIRATDPLNIEPIARFTALWNGVTVTLDATSSSDADGNIASYRWDLGDGTAKSGPTIQHDYAQPGTYNVSLTVTDDSGGIDTLTKAVTFTAPELKVFEINRLVTTDDRGFPWDQPPAEAANGDWTTPINYAEGTLHMRAEIRGQPVAQAMKLQFCMWQYELTLETCTSTQNVPGTSGTVATWSSYIPTMFKKDGNPMDWENPRQRYGLAIKNSDGLPVSDFLDWNWNGEDPDDWYPLDIRFTVVAVPPGETFGGWTNDVFDAAPGYITDSTPPAIGPVSVSAGQTSAVVSWTTSEPTTAVLVYGLTSGHGTGEAESPSLSTSHSVTLGNLTPGTTYHYRIDAFDAAGNSSATGDLTFSTQSEDTPSPVIVSDDFNEGTLDTDVWTFIDPLGDATLSLNGAQAAIAAPGGTAHDIWSSGNFAPRLMQAAPDADFEVEVKLDSPVTQRFQIQGLVVEESPGRFMRFDVHHDGTGVRVFAATVVDGTASIRHNVLTALSGSPIYLRLAREGDLWTPRYSTDGITWQTLNAFSHAMDVGAIGVFAGNAASSGSPVPAHTAVFDHFFDTAAPIDPEPGAPVITTQPADLVVSEGETATFSVVAEGDAPLAYQWARDGVPIDGANSASYSIPSASTADDGALFVVTVSNSAGSVASRAARLDVAASGAPLIDVWYGPEQSFGTLGVPQWAINVLGNISDPDGLGQATYSLNGGAAQALSVGPFRRLEAPGDFNVEIPFSSLISGANLIEIRATDSLGNEAVETVTVQYSPGNAWPLDYAVDWATTGKIHDVAQIVDGDWGIVGGALRPIQRGYDRLVAIGDLAWTDYEVTVPVTLHGFDAKGFERPNFKPALGVMLKWPGHTNWTETQPAWGYYPAGGGAWYEFEQDGSGSLYMTDFENFDVVDPLGRTLSTDVTYIWKVRVESLIGGSTRYSAKIWPATDPEPTSWEIVATDTNDVEGGSLLLVAHYVDASFGNVAIGPITSDPNDPPPPPVLHHGVLDGVGASWQTVTLPYDYTNPVVVASVRYPDASVTPVVTRIRNAFGNQFEVRVQNPSDQPLNGTYSVYYTVVEAGVYTEAQHGIKMEAVRFTSNNTNYSGAWWQQEARSYANSYTAPVVLGQVMSANDPRWSAFWARGGTTNDPPDSAQLSASKHVGEDPITTRANEQIGYLVIESGNGEVGGIAYQAGVSDAAIQGIDGSPPFSVTHQLAVQASGAIVSSAGMKGGNGGWPVLFGSDPLANGGLALAIDEDQLADAERSHGAEQVAYLVLGGDAGPSAPTVTAPPDITAEATGILTGVDLGTATASDGSPVSNDAPTDGFPLGLSVVTWSATNTDGLTGTAEQQVEILDTTAPQLAVPPDIVTEATGTLTPVELGEATATDLFEPVTIVNDAPSEGFPVGITVVTWTATDANANAATAEQSVTVTDGTGNLAPLAVDDSAIVGQGGAVTIAVLDNDSDPDGTLDPATVVVQSGPASGTLSDDGTGVLTYTHDGSATTTDAFSYRVADTEGAVSNIAEVAVTITPPDTASAIFHHGTLTGVDDTWRTVTLPRSYANPVVIAAVQYDTPPALPAIARVRNAAGNSFEVRVQNPGDAELEAVYTLYYTVVDAGVYTLAEHGIQMEAVRFNSTQTSGKGNWSAGNTRAYAQSYTNPVVVGQVMSANDPRWSAFWARGGSIKQPPTSSTLVVSKHVGEDFENTRADETIGYLVIEAGSGTTTDNTLYAAGLSAQTVAGVEGAPPYAVPYPAGIAPSTAALSASAMQGGDGGWPILYGLAPLGGSTLDLAFQEDQLGDLEMTHTNEQVAYLLLEGNAGPSAPTVTAPPDITAEATGILTGVDLGTATASDGSPVSNDAPTDGFPLGLSVVTWSATNTDALTGTAEQQVEILDTTAPQLAVPPDIVTEAAGTLTPVELGEATATDLFEPVTIVNDAPSEGFPVGITVVTWTATDANANAATAEQSVTVTDGTGNLAPLAVDDSAIVGQGGAVTIAVLDNDSDPDGTLDPATVVVQSGPASGTLSDDGTGVLTYTHDGSATTADSFTYTVNDDLGATSNAATVVLDVTSGAAWWSNQHGFRVEFEVSPGATALTDKVTSVPIDFTTLLAQAGASAATLDANSLRLVEVDASGTVIDPAVPFQFDPAADYAPSDNAVGELVILLTGSTPASGSRRFALYFTETGIGLPPPPVLPRVSVTDDLIDEGQTSIRTRTLAGDWFYHKEGAGFSSLNDLDGNDWIGYSTATGSAGEFRGTPNLVPPGSGGHFHPGATTSSSVLLDAGPLRARIQSETLDGEWGAMWEILPTHATMTVTRAPENYWFLYEGTPGGSLEPSTDLVVRSTGTQSTGDTSWAQDLPGEEWAYFADPGVGRSLFVSGHLDDSAIDSYRPLDNVMTVFGLGRNQLNALLSGTSRRFSVGLVDSTAFASIAPVVRSASADDVTANFGLAEARSSGSQPVDARALSDTVSGPASLTIQVDGSASISNAGSITGYAWDFGDGESATGALATHTYSQTGIFTVTLTVTSSSGASNTDHFAVAVGVLLSEPAAQPPTVTPPPDITAEATGLLTDANLGTATASDGSPVSNDAPTDGFPLGLTVVTWSATNADGTGTAEQQVEILDTTAPQLAAPPDIVTDATGTLTPVELGEATATDLFEPVTIVNDAPSEGFPVGATVVTWTATDANANAATAEQSVTILGSTLNEPPLAADDTASVVRGGSVAIDVLANDSDPDGTLDPATVVIQSAPASGTVNDDGTGVLTYTHDGSATTTDAFSYRVADTEGAVSNIAEVAVTITPPDTASAIFHHGTLTGVDDTWRTVTLPRSYANPVVIAAVQYDTPPALPAIARVRNAAGNSFEVRVQNPGDAVLDAVYTIHYTVVEAGVYTLAEHGIQMEAVRFNSTQTSGKGNWSAGNTRAYAQSYTNPVVVGQVMSANDPRWSAFWARGGSIKQPPTSSTLVVSKHVGEDFENTRADETIGYLVIEAGSGTTTDNTLYAAGLSAQTVAGVEGAPPYAVPYPAGIAPSTAALSASAMQGGDGGWPILYGLAPLGGSTLDLAFQEDQLGDLEMTHIAEQVAYLLLQ